MSATVQDVMTTDVVTVKQDATFKDIATKLGRHRVSAFPVIDDEGKVIGVVSEADLLPKEALVAGAGLPPGRLSVMLHHKEFSKAGGVTAADLMTRPAVTVTADEPVTSAARLMYSCKVKRLPVVDSGGHLVGIVSRADVLGVYERPDEEILVEVRQGVILNDFLSDPRRFTVAVEDGVVTIAGRPDTAESGHGIVSRIWRVEGVVSVRDLLTYPPARHSVPGPGPLF
ncbi:MAG TPA: CBS domain-containing protein [Streptosporangiaceae bacterium]|nr:CBS domain-containing protein [Streptosporangiaceae bacterium]